jgi:DNA repair protein RecO (recombination protein O)
MYWKDEGYLLSKKNLSENSIIIEAFTLDHGKYTGVVYGGTSRKQKKYFQIGNKILLNWNSKSENKIGYFNIEIIDPISPKYFDNKKKSMCILSATSILKILLPERQINKQIYISFEKLIYQLNFTNWIKLYIYWELSLIKELGFEVNFKAKNPIKINDRLFKIPQMFLKTNVKNLSRSEIKEALIFNKSVILETFVIPNKLKLPISRNILEKYYS